MPVAQTSVGEAVAQIIALLQGPHKQPGEAIVRQVIVLRLLQAAGWDIWNPDLVTPEETNVGGRRPDFLIGLKPNAFALELKGMNVAFGKAEADQAVSYAGSVGVRWAVLTNGRIWVLLDESLPGPFHEREVLRLELTLGEPEPFAGDFAALLGASVWQEGRFEDAVREVREQQVSRQEQQRVLREKRPEVEAFQKENDIGSFEKAAGLYAQLGRITEVERDVLLGRAVAPASPAKPQRSTRGPQPLLVPEIKVQQPSTRIRFQYKVGRAAATALYDPRDGSWLVQAGSTALNRHTNNPDGQRLQQQREELVRAGILEQSDGLYTFLRDLKFTSPSAAAVMVSGYPESGWDKWKDAEGRSAQHYRPSKG